MFNRRRTTFRVAALAGAICAGAALYGCGGGEEPTTTPAGPTNTGDVGGMGSAMGMGGGGGGQQIGGGVMAMGGGPGGGAAQGGGAALAANADKSMPPHRVDPFKPTWPPPPPPNVLRYVAPVRIADRGTAIHEEQPNIEITEVPQMRVAGILSGSGIYALLEGGPGDGSVVKPGDTVGDYRVASINQDSIILKKTVKSPVGGGTQTYTQIVPLTDSGSGGAAMMSGPGMGRPAGPGVGRPGFGIPGGGSGTGKLGVGGAGGGSAD